MTKKEKIIIAIQNNSRAVRFDDACAVAGWLGFTQKGGKGSHRAFCKPGETYILNFQNRNGYIPPYQAKQLIEMVEKYGQNKDEV